MKAKQYRVLELAIENGVRSGLRRFYKHRDDEQPDGAEDAIVDEVMTSLAEWFDFEEEEEYGD